MTSTTQPKSCVDALKELKQLGVKRLDIDTILDERSHHELPQLVVGHPMEYKREYKLEQEYSPCGTTNFDEMVDLLKTVYGSDFFISIEPKGAWKNTPKELQDPALTNVPSQILKHLLQAVKRHQFNRKNCAVIVEIYDGHNPKEIEEEKAVLNQLLDYCQLYKAFRLVDSIPNSMENYDAYMPTIEFHPKHDHNNGHSFPDQISENSLFWVVDSINDLKLAAELRPKGIVSNTPKTLLDTVRNDPNWCTE